VYKRQACLYQDQEDFLARLRTLLSGPIPDFPYESLLRYDWSRMAPLYDKKFAELVKKEADPGPASS